MIAHRRRNATGFTLFEVLLALGISLVVAAYAINNLRATDEQHLADAAGQQVQEVGYSLNTYIALRYNELVTLTSVTGAGTAADPGPRTCSAATGICTITTDTLRNNGLLPASFTGINSFGATYEYFIKVTGSAPNYEVNGIVVTNTPYVTGGTTPRYDLLGEAMLTAGADSGMTRVNGNEVDGLNGTWVDTSWSGCDGTPTDSCFGNGASGTLGLLAYRAGYGSSAYAAYLRLDGSTPMTGNLNLGGNDIMNVGNISATGTVSAGSFVAKPGPQALVLDSSANGTSFATGTGSLAIRNANGVLIQNSAGTAPGNLSAGVISGTAGGYSGNLSATGTITGAGLIQGQTLAATNLVYSAGNVQAAGNLMATGNAMISGTATANGIISNGDVTANNGSFLSTNNTGWENTTYGGGWYMSDTTWIRAINNKGVLTTGTIEGGQVQSTARMTTGEYLQIQGKVVAGQACTSNGLQATDANGKILSCVSGVWTSPAAYSNTTTVVGATTGYNTWSYAVCPAGYNLVSGGYAIVSTTSTLSAGPGIAEPINATTYGVLPTDANYGSTYKAVAFCGQ